MYYKFKYDFVFLRIKHFSRFILACSTRSLYFFSFWIKSKLFFFFFPAALYLNEQVNNVALSQCYMYTSPVDRERERPRKSTTFKLNNPPFTWDTCPKWMDGKLKEFFDLKIFDFHKSTYIYMVNIILTLFTV